MKRVTQNRLINQMMEKTGIADVIGFITKICRLTVVANSRLKTNTPIWYFRIYIACFKIKLPFIGIDFAAPILTFKLM